jgi:endonuclease/exonuclease/phosphatase family metal-dependent hydrolase
MDRIPSPWLPGTLVLVALLVGCDSGGEGAWNGPGTSVKVMTRNVYLGGEFDSLIGAQTIAQLPGVVDTLWKGVQASDFPARAALIADEVAAEEPDIVAFQELELFRIQTPSDFDPKAAPNAADTAPNGDLLAILTAALAARGLDYGEAVAVATHTDTEMPAADASSGATYDLRLTDRDAVFARPGLRVSNVRTADFPTFISLPVPLSSLGAGILVQLKRGYSAMDVTAPGAAQFTFAATHLEVGGQASAYQEGEARDLMTALAPIAGPLVLVGDFNSAADRPGADLLYRHHQPGACAHRSYRPGSLSRQCSPAGGRAHRDRSRRTHGQRFAALGSPGRSRHAHCRISDRRIRTRPLNRELEPATDFQGPT